MSEHDDVKAVIQRARQSLQCSEEMLANHDRRHRQFLAEQAGPLLDTMLHSRQDAENCLKHPDFKVRFVALNLLCSHWKPDQNFAKTCECMAFNDPDLQIRGVALSALGTCYRGTNDSRVGKLLAAIVHDEQEPASIRSSAYLALFSVPGLIADWPGLHADPPTGLRFPDDVDWSFVNSFLTVSKN